MMMMMGMMMIMMLHLRHDDDDNDDDDDGDDDNSGAASEASCRSKRVDDHSRFYANFRDFLPTRLRIRTFLLMQLSLGLLLVLVQLRQLFYSLLEGIRLWLQLWLFDASVACASVVALTTCLARRTGRRRRLRHTRGRRRGELIRTLTLYCNT